MAMLVDPLDASTTVPPGWISPRRKALLRMYVAIRSLVEPLGLRNSSLHQIVGPSSLSRTGTKGVGGVRPWYRLISGSFVLALTIKVPLFIPDRPQTVRAGSPAEAAPDEDVQHHDTRELEQTAKSMLWRCTPAPSER